MALELLERARICVEAPTAASAAELERRLACHEPATIEKHGQLFVEIEGDDEELDEVVVSVRHWLEDERIAETVVHTDIRARHVRPAPSAAK